MPYLAFTNHSSRRGRERFVDENINIPVEVIHRDFVDENLIVIDKNKIRKGVIKSMESRRLNRDTGLPITISRIELEDESYINVINNGINGTNNYFVREISETRSPKSPRKSKKKRRKTKKKSIRRNRKGSKKRRKKSKKRR